MSATVALRTGGINDDVTAFRMFTADAAINLPVQDQGCAHAGSNRDHSHAWHTLACSYPRFAQCCCISVVFKSDRHTKPFLQRSDDIYIFPAGQGVRVLNTSPLAVER